MLPTIQRISGLVRFRRLPAATTLRASVLLQTVSLAVLMFLATTCTAEETKATPSMLPGGRLETGLHEIRDLAMTADGKRLAVAGNQDFEAKGVVQVWDLETDVKLLQVEAGPDLVAISPSGNSLLLQGADGKLQLLDVDRRQKSHEWQCFDRLVEVAFTRDKGVVAAGFNATSGAEQLVCWDADSSQERFAHIAGKAAIRAFDLSADGRWAVCGAADGSVFLCDLRTGECAAKLSEKGEFDVVGLAASPDGKRIASKLYASEIEIWDVASAEKMSTLTGSGNLCRDVVFLADGNTVAAASSHARGDTVSLWDATLGDEVVVLRQAPQGEPGNHRLVRLTASADGQRLAACDQQGTVFLWDIGNFVGEPIAVPLAAETRRKPVTPPLETAASSSKGEPAGTADPETAAKPAAPFDGDAPPAAGQPAATEQPPMLEDAPSPPGDEQAIRPWTSADGKFTVEAAFLEQDGELVYLKRADGVELQVRIDKLSEADRDFVRKRSSRP